jgi:hypothetical protein
VKVRFAHHTATPTFETLAVVRAFAAHYNGSVDSHYRTPTGMTVSLCLPAPSEAHAASVQRQ